MVALNKSFFKLQNNYLFSSIAKKVKIFQERNPDKKIISLGIGDVTLPLPEVCVTAMQNAIKEMSQKETFKGYGPEQGYDFLRKKITEYDYKDLDISTEEIFVSDGAKCDIGRIVELFNNENIIAVTDPVYPAYVDTNVICGKGAEALYSSDGLIQIKQIII